MIMLKVCLFHERLFQIDLYFWPSLMTSIFMLKMWEKNMNMKKYLKDSLKTI